ncbi:hypothetical protein PAXRUDRAFT_18394 [Paxillus rubicundulus Ve08.2h10]|uniref:Uncharacterized protein n=1 Tax=Paxillus rubicundulus Ve08.2h10 TaxID=930991 RepID=A0A0D0DEX9_9AGAM|nr:hypothetical protein PAXRUDRAFT_18394 [Paxillus rubicundulus Ve08.2h10]
MLPIHRKQPLLERIQSPPWIYSNAIVQIQEALSSAKDGNGDRGSGKAFSTYLKMLDEVD